MERILIRHLSGARAGQVDEFPAAATNEILVGRDPEASVRFDPSREDLVSRQHLKIVRDPEAANEFAVVDLQSRNGTFLNRQRIYAPARLAHSDVIQLGPAGPEFRFEIDPPPFPTRSLEHSPAALILAPSHEDAAPRPIGRATVERMLGDTFTKVKHESDKAVWVGAAALTAILVVGGITYVYMRQNSVDASLQAQQNQQQLQQMGQELKKTPEMAAAAMHEEVQRLNDQLKVSEQRNAESLRKLSQQMAEQTALTREAIGHPAEDSMPPQPSSPPVAEKYPASTKEPPHDSGARPDYDAAVRRGVGMLADGNAEGALQVAQQLMQSQPNRWEAYSIAGSVAKLQNKPTQAKSMFERALSLAPDEVKPSLQQALTEIAKGGQ
jgi:tetratricopeptide (TPR) repeat protein